MKIMVDTSCWVAAMVEAHPAHERARTMLERFVSNRNNVLVCAHTLAEVYAVLTRLPLKPRIGPDVARSLIRENIENLAKVIPLDSNDYTAVLNNMAESGLTGGVVYDALIMQAAGKSGVERLFTLNETDFHRIGRHTRVAVVSP